MRASVLLVTVVVVTACGASETQVLELRSVLVATRQELFQAQQEIRSLREDLNSQDRDVTALDKRLDANLADVRSAAEAADARVAACESLGNYVAATEWRSEIERWVKEGGSAYPLPLVRLPLMTFEEQILDRRSVLMPAYGWIGRFCRT